MLTVISCGLTLNFWKCGSTLEPVHLEREKFLAPQPPLQTSSFLSPGTRDFVACNHLRSYKYYSESILNPDGFASYPCASYRAFESVSDHPSLSPSVGQLSCWDICSVWPSLTCLGLSLWVYDPEKQRGEKLGSRWLKIQIRHVGKEDTGKSEDPSFQWSRKFSCKRQCLNLAWKFIEFRRMRGVCISAKGRARTEQGQKNVWEKNSYTREKESWVLGVLDARLGAWVSEIDSSVFTPRKLARATLEAFCPGVGC